MTAALACLPCDFVGASAYVGATVGSQRCEHKGIDCMPRTIDEGFRDFLPKLTPTDSESEAARRHRASIQSCLETNFGVRTFFRIGSFGNGTSISGHSDVDYIASINTAFLTKPDNSGYMLTKVRDALDATFPRTGVRVNCPAVKLPFGTDAKETTEVVPSYFLRKDGEYRIYDIADCSSGWMRSSPDAHNDYVRSIDDRLGGKVKPLIRFVKAWKFFQNVPISSFYLELRVARYAQDETSIVYDIGVRRVLEMLNNSQLASMQDPKGISGYIRPCSTEQKLEDAKSKLATAVTRAQKAHDANTRGDIAEAFEWWSKLFGERFPSYYK